MSVEKVLVGGSKGVPFDDVDSLGVKKVTVGADDLSVTYIKIEYISKDGKVETREHGENRGELTEFLVDYPSDKIVAVGGSYDHIFTYDTTLITSLYFTTSKGFTSQLSGKMTGKEFKFEDESGGKLLGFCGRSGTALDAIGAFFETSPKIGPVGGNKGNTFDDSVFDRVKKVSVSADEYSITSIIIEYENNEKVEIREHGTIRGELKEFAVEYPNDNIVAIGGSYDHIFTYDTTLITSLYFTTSKGFTSPKFGETKGTEFKLQNENGGKLVGFFGRSGSALDAIGGSFETPLKSE